MDEGHKRRCRTPSERLSTTLLEPHKNDFHSNLQRYLNATFEPLTVDHLLAKSWVNGTVSGNVPCPTFCIKCAKFIWSCGNCNWTTGAWGAVEPAACSCWVCATVSGCIETGFCCDWVATVAVCWNWRRKWDCYMSVSLCNVCALKHW